MESASLLHPEKDFSICSGVAILTSCSHSKGCIPAAFFRCHDPTFDVHSDCFGGISSVVPGATRVGAHVEGGSIFDHQAGDAVVVLLHHVISLVIAPHVLGSWVARGGALEPTRRADLNFHVFKLSDLRRRV